METATDAESATDCPNTPDSDRSIAQRQSSFQRLSGSEQNSTPDQPNNELTVQHTEKTQRCQLRCTYETSMPEHMRHHINSTHNSDEPKEEESAPPNAEGDPPPLHFVSTSRGATFSYLCILFYLYAFVHNQHWRAYLGEGVTSNRFCNRMLYLEQFLLLVIIGGFGRWISEVSGAAILQIRRWRQSAPDKRKYSELFLLILVVLLPVILPVFLIFTLPRPKENIGDGWARNWDRCMARS